MAIRSHVAGVDSRRPKTGESRKPEDGGRDPSAGGRLYPRLLDSSWMQLAEPVRLAHAAAFLPVRLHGRFRITRGGGRLARAAAAMLRLPRASGAAETRLVVTSRGDGEEWHRRFGDRVLNTRQYQTGQSELGERIGILELRFALEASEGSLVFRQREAALMVGAIRVRLPSSWAPRVQAREDPAGPSRVRVHVRLVFPVLGTLLTYDGVVDVEQGHE